MRKANCLRGLKFIGLPLIPHYATHGPARLRPQLTSGPAQCWQKWNSSRLPLSGKASPSKRSALRCSATHPKPRPPKISPGGCQGWPQHIEEVLRVNLQAEVPVHAVAELQSHPNSGRRRHPNQGMSILIAPLGIKEPRAPYIPHRNHTRKLSINLPKWVWLKL